MILGLIRTSPAVQAACAMVMVFGLVSGGVYMLRRDARIQAVQQCTSEKVLADVSRQLAEQKTIAAVHAADARRASSTIQETNQQLAASEAALQKAKDEADELRNRVSGSPGESDVVYAPGDEWLSRRVRRGGSHPAAGSSR